MYFPIGTYLYSALAGPCSPYWGGFGHYAHPTASGAGYLFPAYTFPCNFQGPATFAKQAGFIRPTGAA
jgi:hypothetical protein